MSSLENQIACKCPECDFDINLPAGTEEHEILECNGCGVELEVSQINGSDVVLDLAPDEGEDWGE